MKEMDDIEQMFSDAFSGSEVTPPAEVKENIDKVLFGEGGRGAWYMRKTVWLLLLLIGFGVAIGSYKLITLEEDQPAQVASADIQDDSHSRIKKENEIWSSDSNIEVIELPETNEVELEGAIQPDVKKVKAHSSQISDNNNFADHFSDATAEVNSDDIPTIKIESIDQRETEKEISTEKITSTDGSIVENDSIMIAEDMVDTLFDIAPNNQRKLLRFSLYSGFTNGSNSYNYTDPAFVAMDRELSESYGFNSSLEISFPIMKTMDITSGFELNLKRDQFLKSVNFTDSTFIGVDTVFVWNDPNQQDTIIDTLYNSIYEYNEYTEESRSVIKTTCISIPVYLTYRVALARRLTLGTSIGARFSYSKYNFVEDGLMMSENTYRKYGVSLILRPELVYNIERLGVGVYGKAGYDLVNGLSSDLTRVRRFEYGAGVCLKYSF